MSSMLGKLGMPRDGTKVFHSLRHNVNNAFVRLELDGRVPEKVRLRILGHAAGDGANIENYFADFNADETAKFVKLLDFSLQGIARFDVNDGVKSIRGALTRKMGARKGNEDMGPLNRD